MFDVPVVVFGALAVLTGLTLGSFGAACVIRIPAGESLWGRSHCPSCNKTIRACDLVPLLSWALLRGRCRACGSAISAFYPAFEALCGVLALLVFRHLVADAGDLTSPHLAAFLHRTLFVCLLLIAATVDIRHRIIPDETSIYAVPLGIAGAIAMSLLGFNGWMGLSWQASVIGATVCGGFFALMSWGSLLLTGAVGLGWGDVKLSAMIGAFVGVFPGALTIFMAGSMLGTVVGLIVLARLRRRTYVPFGPPLALAGIVYTLWGDVILHTLLPSWRVWGG